MNAPIMSIVIPCHNSAKTIGLCLDRVLNSKTDFQFEVVVVDDLSTDNTADIVKSFPSVHLVRLNQKGGASVARNAGVRASRGEVIFFIDSDCLIQADTLSIVVKAYLKNPDSITGGSYTPLPYDNDFFSKFQSVFVNYSELKSIEPDYVATHAMVIKKDVFNRIGGFEEMFMPILEDVEFSHRATAKGVKLLMDRSLLVTHVFNFNLSKSLRNAVKKTIYWIAYSLTNKDLFKDSGTASIELKFNGICLLLNIFLGLTAFVLKSSFMFLPIGFINLTNVFVSRKFIGAMNKAGGFAFALKGYLYYSTLYPSAILYGTLRGMIYHLRGGNVLPI